MKVQTSLEFLIIMGAVSALMLSSITQYSGVFSSARQASNLSYGNYTLNLNQSYFQKPYVEINIPSNSTANQENAMQILAYGCNNGTAHVSLNSSGVAFSPSAINESFYSMRLWPGSFYPSSGMNNVVGKYTVYCNGKKYAGYEDLTTYSRNSSQPYLQAYSAYIYGRNEIIQYPLSSESILSLSESIHCTDRNAFSGIPFGISTQCGTSDAWEYMAYSDYCFDHGSPTLTVCIVPSFSGYSLRLPSQPANYIYSANLSIVANKALQSHISSNVTGSPIVYSGQNAGTAVVTNVSTYQDPPAVSIIEGKNASYANQSYYGQYQQAKNSLYSTLGFYNSTIVTSNIQSEINQTISTYDNHENKLISSVSQKSQYPCSIGKDALQCTSSTPFFYTIEAKVSNGYISANQTLSYAGSLIMVNN